MRTDAGDEAEDDNLKGAADRLVRFALDVDVVNHLRADFGVKAADGISVNGVEVGDYKRLAAYWRCDRADADDVRADGHAHRG